MTYMGMWKRPLLEKPPKHVADGWNKLAVGQLGMQGHNFDGDPRGGSRTGCTHNVVWDIRIPGGLLDCR